MKLIVGLGNPDSKHEKTRHNLGFMIIDSLFKNYSSPKDSFKEEKKFKSQIAELKWQPKKSIGERVILAKPLTYMNNSGLAVKSIASFYKISSEDVWIIHDEVDLPLGAMKIRLGGSSAGHKGVESILENLKTDKFWRFRMGIGEQKSKLENPAKGEARYRRQKSKLRAIDDFVLGGFGESERGKAREIIKKGTKAIEDALEEGLEKAMNRFNTK
ncbi:MAG: aminoacyl-tRNA hydrolase [Patescibacteria group bacterium]|nr:aminoacyl-tRNA hydrolase [Patescibacteria group bacterium]